MASRSRSRSRSPAPEANGEGGGGGGEQQYSGENGDAAPATNGDAADAPAPAPADASGGGEGGGAGGEEVKLYVGNLDYGKIENSGSVLVVFRIVVFRSGRETSLITFDHVRPCFLACVQLHSHYVYPIPTTQLRMNNA